MRRSIATVCLSGLLREKLEAAARAGFDGVEIFESDLLQFAGKPREVRRIAADLGLAIDMFQPFRDFDGATPAQVRRSLERAERKFDVMDELGTDLLLVCSNVQPDALGDSAALAEQFARLAEHAGRRGKRIAYEALAWGSQVQLFSQAWDVVRRVDQPSLGLALDSFHTLALRDDPAPIAQLPGDRIFYVQLADAPWVRTDVLTHSRHFRCFPGQGELDLTGFMRALLGSGYTGTISLEVFNDDFRSAPARAGAVDAMRSLLWLEEQVGQTPGQADGAPRAVALFEPPPAPPLDGWSFVEFASDPAAAMRLDGVLQSLGFVRIGRHRSKHIDLYALGDVRIVLNLEPDSAARSHFDLHGPSVCALALTTRRPQAALERAERFGCEPAWSPEGGRTPAGEAPGLPGEGFEGQAAAGGESALPAVSLPDGSLLHFCERTADGRHAFEADFVIDEAALRRAAAVHGARIDHLTWAIPPGQLDTWVLFQRAVLGLLPQRTTVLNDPYGVIRNRELESPDGAVRCSLGVSERDNTVASRSVSRFGGAGVQQIAIAVDDLLAFVPTLRERGAPLLPVPDNYYDDLAAKYELEAGLLESLRANGVLYERGEPGPRGGDFLHVYLAPFDDRFEFEFVQRRGGYGLYGSTNAPVRLAALAAWRLERAATAD